MMDRADEQPESGCDTLRLWISKQQWQAVVDRLENPTVRPVASGEDRRAADRQPHATRCMMRLDDPGGHSGTYLVQTHDLSSGGIGFTHHHRVEKGARCMIALEAADGDGQVVAGTVAWSRPVDPDEPEAAYQIGVRFETPINLEMLRSAG